MKCYCYLQKGGGKGKGDESIEEMVKDQEHSPGDHLTEQHVVCNTNKDCYQ